MKLYDFLVEHAMFPFPRPNEARTAYTTDVSQFEVGLLDIAYRARRFSCRKLCQALEDILGDIHLAACAENYLLASFSPQLQVDERGREYEEWDMNLSEAQVSI